MFMFQQLDLVSPFQLYFNPILIIEQYQVCKFLCKIHLNSLELLLSIYLFYIFVK